MEPTSSNSGVVEGAVALFLQELSALDTAFSTLPHVEDSSKIDSAYYVTLSSILTARMSKFYAAYDAFVYAALHVEDRPVTCSKSCSACCRHFVSSVEPFELATIHRFIRERESYPDTLFASHKNSVVYEKIMQAEIDSAKDEKAEMEASDRALYRYFLKGRACPFLEQDGACGIYEVRPMSCRMFFSESPARFCAGKAIASPWNRNFQIELPQEAEDALVRVSKHLEGLEFPEELFPGVLAANELFGPFDNS